jgi:hypothetical protein
LGAYIHFSRPGLFTTSAHGDDSAIKVRPVVIRISPSIHHPSHCHEMKGKLLALKSRVSPSNRKKNETKPSPALDNARTVCQLLSNLGSGGINVPGLQVAGLVAVQIIDSSTVFTNYKITHFCRLFLHPSLRFLPTGTPMKRSSTYEGSHSDGRDENLVRSEINGYTYTATAER